MTLLTSLITLSLLLVGLTLTSYRSGIWGKGIWSVLSVGKHLGLRVYLPLLTLLSYIVVNSVNRKAVSFWQEGLMSMRLGYLILNWIIRHLLLFMICLGWSIRLISVIVIVVEIRRELSLLLVEGMALSGYLGWISLLEHSILNYYTFLYLYSFTFI